MSKFFGLDKFEEGFQVKIVSRAVLEAFQRDWQLHHPLSDEQLDCADRVARVTSATMYHGGDILYELEGMPGVWHQACLSVVRRIWKEIPGFRGEKIVLLLWEDEPPKFCNLLKLDADGGTLWTAQPEHPLEGVWSSVEFNDGVLKAYNAAGFLDVIDYETGRTLSRTFVK